MPILLAQSVNLLAGFAWTPPRSTCPRTRHPGVFFLLWSGGMVPTIPTPSAPGSVMPGKNTCGTNWTCDSLLTVSRVAPVGIKQTGQTIVSPYKSRACVVLKLMSFEMSGLIGFNICSCQEPRSSLMWAFSILLTGMTLVSCGFESTARQKRHLARTPRV